MIGSKVIFIHNNVQCLFMFYGKYSSIALLTNNVLKISAQNIYSTNENIFVGKYSKIIDCR